MEIIVNGESINKEVCNQEIQSVWRNHRDLSEKEIKDQAVQNIIDWTLIRQHAIKNITTVPVEQVNTAFTDLKKSHGGDEQFYKNFNVTPKDDDKIKKDLETNIKVSQFLNNLTKDIQTPEDKAIETYYQEHIAEFTNHAQVHAAHIVKQANPQNPHQVYEEMLKIRTELLNGADFKSLAEQRSSCDDNGGDLGTFAPGQMVEEFDTIVFSMQEGEISPVFLTQFGYHIATVYEKFPSTTKELTECKEEILDQLHTEMKDDFIADWVDEQKKHADIQIKE